MVVKNKKNKVKIILNSVLLLMTLIISNLVVEYTFEINDSSIIFSVFTYPFVYYFANKITKESSSIKTINVLFIVLLIQGILYYILSQTANTLLTSNLILGSLLAFGVSQLINLFAYNKLLKFKKVYFINIFALYGLVLLIDNYIFYQIMNFDIDLIFIYSMIIRLAVALVLSAFNYIEIRKK